MGFELLCFRNDNLILKNFRYKSFEKAFSLAIDINDADLFMILFKCAKAHGLDEMAEESMKKADEIYAKEENESHRKFLSKDFLNFKINYWKFLLSRLYMLHNFLLNLFKLFRFWKRRRCKHSFKRSSRITTSSDIVRLKRAATRKQRQSRATTQEKFVSRHS